MTADLEPATRRMADLIRGVPDELLDGPTPCSDTSLGDLLDHVGGLTLAFTAAATKETGEAGSQPPSADASRLGDDWRTRIPRDLAALAEAWRDAGAWSGMTEAGGRELPVPEDAPLLDRVIGLTGRDPAWSPG